MRLSLAYGKLLQRWPVPERICRDIVTLTKGVALLVKDRFCSSLTLLHKRRVELAWGRCYTNYGVERTWGGATGGLQLHRT
jgi:hypothetical protein